VFLGFPPSIAFSRAKNPISDTEFQVTPPSRGELARLSRVLAEFPTLREAVRAAGLEPNPKGEKISTEDLLADWKRDCRIKKQTPELTAWEQSPSKGRLLMLPDNSVVK
jgi:hypothetical protein